MRRGGTMAGLMSIIGFVLFAVSLFSTNSYVIGTFGIWAVLTGVSYWYEWFKYRDKDKFLGIINLPSAPCCMVLWWFTAVVTSSRLL